MRERVSAASRGLALAAVLLAAGCATIPPQPSGMVLVADIINSVKCGLAEALQTEAGRRRLPGSIASVELQLKVVDSRSLGGSVGLQGPSILAWQGVQLLPTLSATSQQAFTVDTVINLTYRLDAPNNAVCRAVRLDLQDQFGFARWLADVIAGLSQVSLEAPRGTLDRLVYDATFAATFDTSAGAGVKVVFLDSSTAATRNRADTQRLRIVISGSAGIATGDIPGEPLRRGAPGANIPNLSKATPSPR